MVVGFNYLDLDSNGVADFQFMVGSQHVSNQIWEYHGDIIPIGNDTNAVLSDTTVGRALHLHSDSLIAPGSIKWFTRLDTLQADNISYCGTNDNPPTEQFMIGLRYLANHQVHYGWIEVNVHCSYIRLLDWAYETQPDSSITVGQTWTGITNTSPHSFATINAYDHEVSVRLNDNSSAHISIYNSAGQLVRDVRSTGNETRISMAGVPAGIYFVEATDGKQISTRKIFLQ